MTFCIALANADQIIQVSDRRLTDRGRLIDDSANKVCHARCDDASFLCCFTGLARVGNEHITSRWLLAALQRAAQRNRACREIIELLAEEATNYFRSSQYVRRLPPAQKRLTLMMSGYTHNDFIFNALISNFQDFVQFIDYPEAHEKFSAHVEISCVPAAENPTMIQAIGQFSALTSEDRASLEQMLETRRPAKAITQKAVALVQDISDRPSSGGTVGKKMNTVRLDRLEPWGPVSGYVTDERERRIYLVDQVDLRTGTFDVTISNMQVSAPQPIVFPKVHRNAPCPCGSGKKFRFCHRR